MAFQKMDQLFRPVQTLIADGLRVQRGESAALQPALRLDWDE
jgi:hypothetical protein